MISHRIGNLLEQPDIDIIVHQANIYHTFGAGIAAGIKQVFPYAYERDRKTIEGDETKIGGYSIAASPAVGKPTVVNLYSQIGLSPSHTSYDAMYKGLKRLSAAIQAFHPKGAKAKVGFPYMIGCGLADGNWDIVKVVIEQAFLDSGIEVVIVKLPEAQ